MNAHLTDNRTLAQSLLVEFWPGADGAQRAHTILIHDNFRIELGSYDGDSRLRHVEFSKDLLREVEHPVDVPIAASHAGAAKNDRAADLFAGGHHVAIVGLDGFSIEKRSTYAEKIGASVHRTAIAHDGVNLPMQSGLQRLPGVTVAESAAGR